MRHYRWPLIGALVIAGATLIASPDGLTLDALILAGVTFIIFFLIAAGVTAYVRAYRREHPLAPPQ